MALKDDILALSRAGFNAAQITMILKTEDPAPAPAPGPAPAPAPGPAPAPAPAPAGVGDILDKLEQLNQTLITGNINRSRQTEPETVDDILAQIIRPTKKE